MTNLLQCPFCGGDPIISECDVHVDDRYYISCYDCGADPGGLHTLDNALTRWNTRHDDA